MKKFVLAVSILGISAASAFAADLPAHYTKAPPLVYVYDWSGFYVGGNGGWGSSRNCWDLSAVALAAVGPFQEGCHNATGGVAGGQIGYRWQTGAFVFGVEGQGDWANLKGSKVISPVAAAAFGASLTDQTKIDAFGDIVGKFGYAFNNALLYVNAGVAVTSDKYRGTTAAGVLVDQAKEFRLGVDAAVGFEYGFTPNWSAAIQYDHLFMDQNANALSTSAGVVTRTENVHQDVDLVTVRVNYHFGGPVVAKY